MRILLNPDPGGQSGGDWLATLPEDIRTSPSITKFKSPADLAKSYTNLEALIGTKRLPEPQSNWGDKEWDAFYEKAGRPQTPDKYPVPEFKFEEGVTLDDGLVEKAKLHFHKLGLSDRQAKGLLEFYFGMENDRAKGMKSTIEQSRATAEEAMKKEFGDKYSARVEQAKQVLAKFDDEQIGLSAYLNETKLGNDPRMVKFLAKIAGVMKEDTSGGASGGGLNLPDKERAKLEIVELKGDKEFMNRFVTGDKVAIARWNEAHRLAYSNP